MQRPNSHKVDTTLPNLLKTPHSKICHHSHVLIIVLSLSSALRGHLQKQCDGTSNHVLDPYRSLYYIQGVSLLFFCSMRWTCLHRMHIIFFMSSRATFLGVWLVGDTSDTISDAVAILPCTSTTIAIESPHPFFESSIISAANISEYYFIVRSFCSCSLETFPCVNSCHSQHHCKETKVRIIYDTSLLKSQIKLTRLIV